MSKFERGRECVCVSFSWFTVCVCVKMLRIQREQTTQRILLYTRDHVYRLNDGHITHTHTHT